MSKSTKKRQDYKQAQIEKSVRAKCYSSIDTLPIWNWFEIFRINNFKWITINGKLPPKKQIPILSKIYFEFYDAYLAEFGLNETMTKILELKKSLINRMNNYIQGDRGEQTFIDIETENLKELQNKTGTMQNIWELKSRMEVALKINIDVKKCSVIEFYSYLKIISEMNNQAA